MVFAWSDKQGEIIHNDWIHHLISWKISQNWVNFEEPLMLYYSVFFILFVQKCYNKPDFAGDFSTLITFIIFLKATRNIKQKEENITRWIYVQFKKNNGRSEIPMCIYCLWVQISKAYLWQNHLDSPSNNGCFNYKDSVHFSSNHHNNMRKLPWSRDRLWNYLCFTILEKYGVQNNPETGTRYISQYDKAKTTSKVASRTETIHHF